MQEAVDWCRGYGLEFDAVNSNIPEMIEWYGKDTRKIGYDVLIDDKAVNKPKYHVPYREGKMSSLDGKITIEREPRPCIVNIPEKRKEYQKKGDNLNVYDKVIEPYHDVKALFHCWNHKSEVIGRSYLRTDCPTVRVFQTFGIVEYEDGTIHEVEPTQIRFVDNAMSEYAFPEMEEK